MMAGVLLEEPSKVGMVAGAAVREKTEVNY